MKRLLLIIGIIFLLSVTRVQASSLKAYQDYLYLFDVYRQKLSDFKIAKDEYLKFKTLTSQTTALDKTKDMMARRDELLRGYLLLLREKLSENTGITDIQKQTYQTLINNEISFLESHSKLIDSIGSLGDAQDVSRQLETHYYVLQSSMRQIVTGISLGDLAELAKMFDINLADARALVETNRGTFAPTKQATIDRWLITIGNMRSLYQQKIDSISSTNDQMKVVDLEDQNRAFSLVKKSVGEARQYLLDGTGYLGELVTALKYQD